jgi:hypothetical protein
MSISSLGKKVLPNVNFGVDVTFKNTGTETWTANYCVAVIYVDRGDVTYQTKSVCIGDMRRSQVLPGEKMGFDFGGFGSETLGIHTWSYMLVDPKGKPVPLVDSKGQPMPHNVVPYYYYSY